MGLFNNYIQQYIRGGLLLCIWASGWRGKQVLNVIIEWALRVISHEIRQYFALLPVRYLLLNVYRSMLFAKGIVW